MAFYGAYPGAFGAPPAVVPAGVPQFPTGFPALAPGPFAAPAPAAFAAAGAPQPVEPTVIQVPQPPTYQNRFFDYPSIPPLPASAYFRHPNRMQPALKTTLLDFIRHTTAPGTTTTFQLGPRGEYATVYGGDPNL